MNLKLVFTSALLISLSISNAIASSNINYTAVEENQIIRDRIAGSTFEAIGKITNLTIGHRSLNIDENDIKKILISSIGETLINLFHHKTDNGGRSAESDVIDKIIQKGLNKTVSDVKNLRTNNDLSKSNLDDISNVVIRGTKEIFTEIYNWTMLQETNEDEDSWKSRFFGGLISTLTKPIESAVNVISNPGSILEDPFGVATSFLPIPGNLPIPGFGGSNNGQPSGGANNAGSSGNSGPCLSGWTYVDSMKKCYKFFDLKVPYSEADKTCKGSAPNNLDGGLVSISTPTVTQVMKQINGHKYDTWTGGYRVNGKWVWADGSPLTYTNWNSGEPNNYKGVEDKLCIYQNGLWNDCSAQTNGLIRPFICQYGKNSMQQQPQPGNGNGANTNLVPGGGSFHDLPGTGVGSGGQAESNNNTMIYILIAGAVISVIVIVILVLVCRK